MQLPDFRLAYRAIEEGHIERGDLDRLFERLEAWSRGDLSVLCAELLLREFRLDPNLVRRWESELSGQPSNRIGPYLLQRRVGQGGMGVVFEAEHPNLKRNVALKILTPGRRDPAAIQRFLREVKSAGQFNHPNIVHAYDAGIDGDIPYLAMEFVAGENLFQYLLRTGPISIEEAVKWLAQATSALWFLEAQGWTHGDGKPSNWIITPNGTLKLVDLGLCRPPGKLRDPEMIHGSPPYIAPEQLGSGERIDIRSDLYALGATFYHLLTGMPPYEARTVAELVRAQRKSTIAPITSRRKEIPTPLARVIHRLLEPRADDRYAGCAALAEAVEALPGAPRVGPATVSTEPPGGGTPAGSSRVGWMYGAVAAAVCVFAGAYLARLWWSAPERTDPGPSTDTPTVVVEPDTPDAPPAFVPDDWKALWEREPRPWPEVFAWLESQPESPEREERRTLAAAAFESEASERWRALDQAIDARLDHREFVAALDSLDRYPRRLRWGAYDLGWRRRHAEVVAARDNAARHLVAEIEAAMDAVDPLTARARYRSIGREPRADRAFYRAAVAARFPGMPWLNEGERQLSAGAVAATARHAEIVTALASGRAPVVDWSLAGADPSYEWVAAFHRANPDLLVDAAQTPLLERLVRTELMARVDRDALRMLLLATNHDPRGLDREIAAAQVARAAWRACREWDRSRAEAEWEKLRAEGYAGTTAARLYAPEWPAVREQLWRGAFLRSEHFAAEVSGEWNEPPRFTYDFSRPDVWREWRRNVDVWEQVKTGAGHRAEGLRTLECFVPFEGAVEVDYTWVPVDGVAWEMVIAYGAHALGLHYLPVGELRATTGSHVQVESAIENGKGSLIIDRLIPSTHTRVRLRYAGGAIRVDWGSLSWRSSNDNRFAPGSTAPGGFVTFRFPHRATLERVVIQGAPSDAWLKARAEVVGYQ